MDQQLRMLGQLLSFQLAPAGAWLRAGRSEGKAEGALISWV